MPYQTTADHTELYYRDWGTGTPVVLIHGWPLSGDMWDQQAEFLASNGCRVITYDRRGFGLSGQPWSGYDYDTFSADLNLFMETLNLQKAVLVGFSMGGGEVARYLGRYGSERVAKAVLMSAVTPFLLKTEDNPEGIDGSEFEKIAAALRADRPAFLRSFTPDFYGRSMINHTVSEAVVAWSEHLAWQASLHSTLAAAKAWSSTDFREDLKKIDIPVRVIHGTGDKTVPIAKSARESMRYLKNATLSEYDGEPHGLFLTATDRLNQELLEFIQPTVATTPAASAVASY